MCTVLVRFDPTAAWPILLAAVRDEFMQRAWDPPAAHWPEMPTVTGGRDRVAGGTWMAVKAALENTAGSRPAIAALLNGVRLGDPEDGSTRPTRGRLVLEALSASDFRHDSVPGAGMLGPAGELAQYDGFHLLRADATGVQLWSWDGVELSHRQLDPGNHIIVNLGADRDEDPLVPHFRPLLEATPDPVLAESADTSAAWGSWVDLLRGDGLALDDPRGLIIEHFYGGRHYGSTSASLVGLAADGRVRYDFTATPQAADWHRVAVV